MESVVFIAALLAISFSLIAFLTREKKAKPKEQ